MRTDFFYKRNTWILYEIGSALFQEFQQIKNLLEGQVTSLFEDGLFLWILTEIGSALFQEFQQIKNLLEGQVTSLIEDGLFLWMKVP